jgi:protein-tyrosine phosphatase
MPSLLFVCKANLIRSPIAAALFKEIIRQSGEVVPAEWRIESAGTWAQEGAPIHRNAAVVLHDDYGLDVYDHSTRIVSLEMLSGFDLILTMEQDHKEALHVEFPVVAGRVYQITEMVGGTWDIDDPPLHSVDNIRMTARLIQKVLKDGKGRILELAGAVPGKSR